MLSQLPSLISYILLVFTFSCIPRFYGNVSIGLSLLIVLLPCYVFIALYRDLIQNKITTSVISITAYNFIVSCIFLYHIAFDGLVSVGGGDTGNHIHVISRFITTDKNLYQGFVGFHTLAYWLKTLCDISYFNILRIIFYSELALIFFVQSLIFHSCIKKYEIGKIRAMCIFLITSILINYKIILPLVHYLQAAGFYPQYFGFIVLLLIAYFFVELEKSRLLFGCCFLIILYRFSYGLNLGDVLLVLGLMSIRNFLRDEVTHWSLFLFSIVFIVCAIFMYLALFPIIGMSGGIVYMSLDRHFLAVFFLSIISIYFLLIKNTALSNKKINNLLEFVVILFCVTGIIQLIYRYNLQNQDTYYITKYAFHASLVFAISMPMLLACLVEEVISALKNQKYKNVVIPCVFLLLLLAACYQEKLAYDPYFISFRQRFSQKTDSDILKPVRDSIIEYKIEEVLNESKQDFGGLITLHWAFSNFVNSSFGYYGELPLFKQGLVKDKAGYCIFLETGPDELNEYEREKLVLVQRKILLLQEKYQLNQFRYISTETGKDKILSYYCIPNS